MVNETELPPDARSAPPRRWSAPMVAAVAIALALGLAVPVAATVVDPTGDGGDVPVPGIPAGEEPIAVPEPDVPPPGIPEPDPDADPDPDEPVATPGPGPVEAVIVIGSGTAPTVRASASTDSVVLSWDPVDRADAYRYRVWTTSGEVPDHTTDPFGADDPSWVRTTGTSVILDGLTPGTVHTIDVGSRVNDRWLPEWTRVEIATAPSALPRPVATVASPIVPLGAAVAFDASATTDPDGDLQVLVWDFGDGAVATGERVDHVYAEPGAHEVTLIAVDAEGNAAPTRFEVVVLDAAPALLDASVSGTTLTATWSPVPGAEAHRYRLRTEGAVWGDPVEIPAGTGVEVDGLVPGATYELGVTSRVAGHWSDRWTTATVEVPPAVDTGPTPTLVVDPPEPTVTTSVVDPPESTVTTSVVDPPEPTVTTGPGAGDAG